jgi:hypothetical protein
MYASIRPYTFKASMDKKSLDAYKERLESKFVPTIHAAFSTRPHGGRVVVPSEARFPLSEAASF